MQDYDQRWVRRDGTGFRLATTKGRLCDVCGDRAACHAVPGEDYIWKANGVETQITNCRAFVPVLPFQDMIGLDGVFNTFRRGVGWYRRLSAGVRVKFFDVRRNRLAGQGRVVETHSGELGALLPAHAYRHHMMRDVKYEDKSGRLKQVLARVYGKNYSAADQTFTVVYVEGEQNERELSAARALPCRSE